MTFVLHAVCGTKLLAQRIAIEQSRKGFAVRVEADGATFVVYKRERTND